MRLISFQGILFYWIVSLANFICQYSLSLKRDTNLVTHVTPVIYSITSDPLLLNVNTRCTGNCTFFWAVKQVCASVCTEERGRSA